jgi:MarR family transcriptional regulator, temperature-dependent positive regulator of motility
VTVRRTTTSLARRFYQICLAMVADSLSEAHLTPLQFGAFAYLNKENGEPGIDQTGLAARLGVDRNSTSVIVAELERRGLLERRVSDVDQRARALYLTAEGEKLYRRLRPNNVAANDRVLAPLNPREREQLRDLLVRIIQANAAYARPGGGRRKRGTVRSLAVQAVRLAPRHNSQ